MAESDEWTSDANKALTISILQPALPDAKVIATFHPKFTYPIFGDAQTIWGYQGLHIELRFTFQDLRSNLKVWWREKHATVGETAPLDIKKTLKDWLPDDSFSEPSQFEDSVRRDVDECNFRPPGELLTRYCIGDRKFEVWHASLKPNHVQDLFSRMQIFTPLFIEGGTYINLDDPDWSLDRWRLFLLYEMISESRSPHAPYYSFMGYCTVYRYPFFSSKKISSKDKKAAKDPSNTPFELPNPAIPPINFPCRQRISQFVILPAYQHQGHGSAFYSSIFNYFLASPNVYEVTVEDPNESFDDLRDYCDLVRLRKHYPAFRQLRIKHTTKIPKVKRARVPTSNILLPLETLEGIRRKTKIAPRQFARLVEMQLLSLTPKDILQSPRVIRRGIGLLSGSSKEEKTYRLWRLLVKQRIYKRNSSLLTGLERGERVDKLDDTLDDLEADYLRILQSAERPGVEDEQLQPVRPVEDEDNKNGDKRPSEQECSPNMDRCHDRDTDEKESEVFKRSSAQPPRHKKTDKQEEKANIVNTVKENGNPENEIKQVKSQQVEAQLVETETQSTTRDEPSLQLLQELREWNERIARKQQAQQGSRHSSVSNQPDSERQPQPAQPPPPQKPQETEVSTRGRNKRPAPTSLEDGADVGDNEESTDHDEVYETGVEEWDVRVGPPEPDGQRVVDDKTGAATTKDKDKDKRDRHVSKRTKF